jgi:hypothetical protein
VLISLVFINEMREVIVTKRGLFELIDIEVLHYDQDKLKPLNLNQNREYD